MKRPALCLGFPFVLGLTLASVFRQPLWMLVCGGAVLAGGILLLPKERHMYILLSTLSCLTACCVYWYTDTAMTRQQLPFAGEETVFTGQITDITQYESGYAQYYLDGTLGGETSARVEFVCAEPAFGFGDTVTLRGCPEVIQSSYVLRAEDYARAEGILLAFPMQTEILSHVPLSCPTLRRMIYDWRVRTVARIREAMGTETGAVLTGMLFGEKQGISRGSRTALYRAGIGHLLAVSGLHLDFLALCVSWVLERLHADRRLRFALLSGVCVLFVLCAGETVSVRRACIMILLREGAGLAFRTPDAVSSLSVAMLILGVTNPFVVHSGAFWLSCSGAFGMGVLAPAMRRELPLPEMFREPVQQLTGFCWVFAAVLPASVVFFREVSLISPLSNMLLVPVCLAAMLCGTLAVLLGGQGIAANILLFFADRLLAPVLWVTEKLMAVPWTYLSTGSRVLLFTVFGGVGLTAGIFLLSRSRRLSAMAAACAVLTACMAVRIEQTYTAQQFRIAVLGSGRDCVLVLSGGQEAVLADVGGASDSAAYAEAYLEEQGIRQVEMLYLCAPNAKSAVQYGRYLEAFPPARVCLLREKVIPPIGDVPAEQQTSETCLFHGARITVTAEEIRVEYAGVTYLCTGETVQTAETPELMTVYGKSRGTLPACGILTILDAESPYRADAQTYVGEQDLEITITAAGNCRVRRL